MEPRRLRSQAELDEALAATSERPLVLLKHSTRCFSSRWAQAEIDRFADMDAARLADIAIVYVVEDRAVSDAVRDRLGVAHESPQAFVVVDGRATWSDSHSAIDADRVAEAVRRAVSGAAAT